MTPAERKRWREAHNGFAADWPMQFTAKQIRDLFDQLDATERELERWKHGVTVEGDFVCPDSDLADRYETALERIAEVRFRTDMDRIAELEAEVAALKFRCGGCNERRCSCTPCIDERCPWFGDTEPT